jgi:hypothetical protein
MLAFLPFEALMVLRAKPKIPPRNPLLYPIISRYLNRQNYVSKEFFLFFHFFFKKAVDR